jgi:hypothetical protein
MRRAARGKCHPHRHFLKRGCKALKTKEGSAEFGRKKDPRGGKRLGTKHLVGLKRWALASGTNTSHAIILSGYGLSRRIFVPFWEIDEKPLLLVAPNPRVRLAPDVSIDLIESLKKENLVRYSE